MNGTKKNLVSSLLLLSAVTIFLASCGNSAQEHQPPQAEHPDIEAFVVCNTYWGNIAQIQQDEPETVLQQPESGKLLIMFLYDTPAIDTIESITAYGPNEYKKNFALQPYTRQNLNGYSTGSDSYLSFMFYDTDGFLEDGEYTIDIEYTDGFVSSITKTLNFDRELLDTYLEMQKDFSPAGNVALNADDTVVLEWPMPETGQYFAVTRLKEYVPNDPFYQNILYWDNIFYRQGNAGLGRSSMQIPADLIEPGVQYTWFTEILDSNKLEDVNTAIFCPFQYFQIAE